MNWSRRLAAALLGCTLLWAGSSAGARDTEDERLRAIGPDESMGTQPQRTPVKLALPWFALRRVLLTGEEEHLWIVDGLIVMVRHDPDAPTTSFSSGVDDDAAYERTPAAQKRPPELISGPATLQFDAQEWVQLMEAAEKTPLVPRRLMQQQASLGQDVLKVSIDHLPRLKLAAGNDDASPQTSSASPDTRGGSLLIKVEFRGKTSLLMEAGFLEEPLAITLGRARDGTPGLQMHYSPDYNHTFSRSWIWDDRAGRFRRWTNHQSQGC